MNDQTPTPVKRSNSGQSLSTGGLGLPKYCTIRNMNWAGEIIHGEFDGTYYVLEDGDMYLPETLCHYEVEYMDIDPRMPNTFELTGALQRVRVE